MIPILFDEYTKDFTSKGIGQLSDTISCLVTEERNGKYELVLKYPITGKYYSEIVDDRIIYVTHDNSGDKQPFVIYSKTAPINGIVTYQAHHVSYALSDIVVKPISASSVSSALNKLVTEAMLDQPFTFWTDKSTVGNINTKIPMSVRSVLGGVEGSILDVYGGEYEFDYYTVKLHESRGEDRNVTVRYAKNMTDLVRTYSVLNKYNVIVPYWSDISGNVVYGDPVVMTNHGTREYHDVWTTENDVEITNENNNVFEFDYYLSHAVTINFTGDFEYAPTKDQLHNAAAAYLNANQTWVPNDNIQFNFVDLQNSHEYSQEDLMSLRDVRLCDTITVIYSGLGVSRKAKIIKTVWNPLLNQYEKLEAGDAKVTLAETIANGTHTILENYTQKTEMKTAIDHATSLITGGMGGHVVFAQDAQGKPTEIFVMDTEDVNTAVHVLRINVNGIGFSSNGVNGPFTTAWTLDGNFVADFITAGTLSADRIRAGILQSSNGSSYWDLDGSEFVFTDQQFDSWVKLDEGYIEFGHGDQVFGKILRMTMNGKDILAIQANSTDDIISIGPDGTHIIHDNTSVHIDTSVRILKGNSKIRLYDDESNQFIDMNSGGENYIRIDGKDKRVWIKGGGLMSNGYKAYDGKITIGDNTLTFHNGILTGST